MSRRETFIRETLNRETLVLVHGWGLNSAVWQPLVELLTDKFECLCIDMSGYGKLTHQQASSNIEFLADELLEQAPAQAHWCAWSLGGMAAIFAAKKQPERFKSLNLLCTTPRFVQDQSWQIGMNFDVFKKFAEELQADYQQGIQKFLLLQAGSGPQARALATQASELIKEHPAPSSDTLAAGLEILHKADLREHLSAIQTACQIISGKRDRVVHPQAGDELSKQIPNAHYQVLNSGHAPQLSHPQELASLIISHSSQ